MSYSSRAIHEAADAIQQTLAEYTLRKHKGVLEPVRDCDIKRYPEATHLHTPEALTDSIIKHLEKCLEVVRQAAVCAELVEWLTSYNISKINFCTRLTKELAAVSKTGGVR